MKITLISKTIKPTEKKSDKVTSKYNHIEFIRPITKNDYIKNFVVTFTLADLNHIIHTINLEDAAMVYPYVRAALHKYRDKDPYEFLTEFYVNPMITMYKNIGIDIIDSTIEAM